MVQLSLSVRGHRVGLLALFATPVIGAESGKAQLASRGRAPACEFAVVVHPDGVPVSHRGHTDSEGGGARPATSAVSG
jgi:hypothetical protein